MVANIEHSPSFSKSLDPPLVVFTIWHPHMIVVETKDKNKEGRIWLASYQRKNDNTVNNKYLQNYYEKYYLWWLQLATKWKEIKNSLELRMRKGWFWFVTLVAQPGSAVGSDLMGSLSFGRERRNKKRNAILNFGIIMWVS